MLDLFVRGSFHCALVLSLLCVSSEGLCLKSVPCDDPPGVVVALSSENFLTELALHPNGRPARQTVYKDSIYGKVRHGRELQWDQEGNLLSEYNYVDDVLDGKASLWYSNGNPRALGWYVNGAQHGQWLHYAESGQLAWAQTWENGKEHGRGVMYDTNGRPKTVYARLDEVACDVSIYFGADGQCEGWDITVPENSTGMQVVFGKNGSVLVLKHKHGK